MTASPPQRKGYPRSAPKGSPSENTGADRGQLALPSRRGRPSVQDRTGDRDLGRKVVALRDLGLSWTRIARALGIGRTTARNLCEKTRTGPAAAGDPENAPKAVGRPKAPPAGPGMADPFPPAITQARGASPSVPDAIELMPLKAAVGRLPTGHPAREVILAEPDVLPRSEYAAKAVVWFRLLQIPKG